MQRSYQQNVIAMHAGKGLITLCGELKSSLQDKFYKSKTSSRFPNFDTSNTWQMGHTLPEMTDKMADAVTRCIVTEHLKMARTLQENVWSGGQN